VGTVHLVDHPLVQHKLTLMRRKDASTNSFRQLLHEVSALMAYEVPRACRCRHEVQTPLENTVGHQRRDLVEQLTEAVGEASFRRNQGELVLDERMVDQVHGAHRLEHRSITGDRERGQTGSQARGEHAARAQVPPSSTQASGMRFGVDPEPGRTSAAKLIQQCHGERSPLDHQLVTDRQ